VRAAGSLLPPEVQFTEYEAWKLLPPFDEDDATLKDRDVVLELDGILVELLYSAQQRRVA
jgi:hypothetical protein